MLLYEYGVWISGCRTDGEKLHSDGVAHQQTHLSPQATLQQMKHHTLLRSLQNVPVNAIYLKTEPHTYHNNNLQ
jgi:hypothetical protein